MFIPVLILTLSIEAFTILGRFFFGPMKKMYPKRILKVRIHHGYIGLAIFLLAPEGWLKIIGLSLLCSDALHHFIVLPLWVGRTEFP